MAFSKQIFDHSIAAASDFNSASFQFCLMKFSAGTDTVVPCTGATDIPSGVLQNLPRQGEQAELRIIGISKIRVGATDLTGYSLLVTDATGRAAAGVAGTDTTKYVIGRIVSLAEGTDNDGALATALVNCANPSRLA